MEILTLIMFQTLRVIANMECTVEVPKDKSFHVMLPEINFHMDEIELKSKTSNVVYNIRYPI